MSANPVLPLGYSPIPKGCLANVATFLEMKERPAARPSRPADRPLRVARMEPADLSAYRALMRAVGEAWMWQSRLVMDDAALAAILRDPDVEIHVLRDGARAVGIAELDFRHPGECELGYFGLIADAIGKGAGRFLMDAVLERAWTKPIRRLWVHTCTFDHPGALAFYIRSGFRPYKFEVEVLEDPRLTGHFPREAAAQVPLLDEASP